MQSTCFEQTRVICAYAKLHALNKQCLLPVMKYALYNIRTLVTQGVLKNQTILYIHYQCIKVYDYNSKYRIAGIFHGEFVFA